MLRSENDQEGLRRVYEISLSGRGELEMFAPATEVRDSAQLS